MDFFQSLSPEQESIFKAVIGLAQTCSYEADHTHQVTRLALILFDELRNLHHLADEERFFLLCAGILHDIGWVEGWQGHHKTSLRIILSTTLLPFKNRQRLIVGSIARYHRKALPDLSHDSYAALTEPDRQLVRVLAACLRVADGLDRSHQSLVKDIKFKITPKKIVLTCIVNNDIEEEVAYAKEKGDLFEKVFEHKLEILWHKA